MFLARLSALNKKGDAMLRLLPLAVLGLFWVLDPGLAQEKKPEPAKPPLTGRIDLEQHKESFTVRFYLRNTTAKDVDVVYGMGGGGKSVVPTLTVTAGSTTMFIHPPTYHYPPRESMKPDKQTIPAGKEILYGTFTMGYPPLGPSVDKEVSLDAVIHFQELKQTAVAEAVQLRLPGGKEAKKGDDK
jgi:hypothetical protein